MNRVQIPTCRVCGCTEISACPGGCSWVRAEKASVYAARKPLCSACSGTAGDMKEAIERGTKILETFSGAAAAGYAVVIGRAALRRRANRARAEAKTIDASWGTR